ncbi:hypothetical protein Pla52o_35130 [Novipirellula galeiformis]|uniref:DUF1320 domain-containing protein n=1 Tax=Novipirellula galeiformis TaxID=2528004 RepID=A0A5C6CFD8_9BACT|nr:phage protein Gp36 family protein [Novipirellula galeiformis]TWU22457.1 hypothetical protein Pla52o_35130 [Novipirellula galeiformis]
MNLYCTADDLNRYLSADGVTAFSDHDDDGFGDSGIVDDCIGRASREIDASALRRYEESRLVGNATLNDWAVVMACRSLCLRRGNMPPESLEMEFHRIVDPDTGFLARLASGRYKLPGLPQKPGNEPTFSNLTVDRRYRNERIRVVRQSSSPEPSTRERDEAKSAVFYDG